MKALSDETNMATRALDSALLLNVKEVELPPLVPEDETLVRSTPERRPALLRLSAARL